MTQGRINYSYPFYTDHTVSQGGYLTFDKRTHALFNYYLLCQKLLEKAGQSIDDQIRYDDAAWLDKPYANIAKSVAIRYGLDSPDDFLKRGIKDIVEREIARLEFPAPAEEYWEVHPHKNLII